MKMTIHSVILPLNRLVGGGTGTLQLFSMYDQYLRRLLLCIPANNDVAAALAKVKNRNIPGSSGILPEMVKMGMNNSEF